MLGRRTTLFVALLVFLITATVYMITLAPSVPFWDAGEFIASSYILGVPHPPGTPFYVMLGRIATLVPWESIAQRVNALSALPSALTVVVTYLAGLKLIRLAQGKTRTTADEWIAQVGAVTGGFMIAFSDSFWENSTEAEVYALMSLAQILVFYMGLRWWEEHEVRPTAGPLLVAVYIMWLSVGLHLGVGLMGLPLTLLVWLVDRRAGLVFMMPMLSVLLVTMGLERLAGGVLLLTTMTCLVYAAQRKMDRWVAWGGAAASVYGMTVAFGDRDFTPFAAMVAVAGLLVPLAMLARRAREGRILLLALSLMIVGYSTHIYLPIRAAQRPAINEGDPATWESFRDLLERKQYGTMNMFQRRAPLDIQLGKEFWRYFSRQWPLFPSDRAWGSLLPLLLGVFGSIWQFRREKISWLYTAAFLGLTTAGLIMFLNFSDREVRERDYFFQSGYHAFALCIGLGVAGVVTWVRDSFEAGPVRRWASIGAATLLALQPALLLKNLWYTHDRRGDYVARDYAYNMLAMLKPNSFMFTNGDNDTFPLWYMQEVENFRKDIRVVNLSLLNTDWYIRQLKDDEPKVPIQLDDATIKLLGGGAVRAPDGSIIYTNEYMVQHILQETAQGTGWARQPYFAVTTPDHFGMDPYLTLVGLAYRVNRDTLQGKIDVPETRRALYDVFRYRGLFTPNGQWDLSVFKDENARTLSRNYAAAHIQLAYWYHRHEQLESAIAEMERVERMFPDFTEVLVPLGSFYIERGDTAKAVALFARLTTRDPGNPEAHYYFGVTLAAQNQIEAALKSFDKAIQLDPDYPNPYFASYYSLYDAGQPERATRYLDRWLELHPQDARTRQLLESQRGSGTGVMPPGATQPPAPPPTLP